MDDVFREMTKSIESGEMTRFDRWTRNRMNTQIAIAAGNAEQAGKTDQQPNRLDDFTRNQMTEMLRVPPPRFPPR